LYPAPLDICGEPNWDRSPGCPQWTNRRAFINSTRLFGESQGRNPEPAVVEILAEASASIRGGGIVMVFSSVCAAGSPRLSGTARIGGSVTSSAQLLLPFWTSTSYVLRVNLEGGAVESGARHRDHTSEMWDLGRVKTKCRT